MKKNLYLVRKPVCLACSWVATGDNRKPLMCVWGTVASASVATAETNSKEERIPMCG